MPLFYYTARDNKGVSVSGNHEANDQYALSRALRAENLTVLSISEKSDKKGLSWNIKLPEFLQPISLEEKINFTRNTAVMIGAGLSLTKAMDVMSRQAHNSRFKSIVLVMADIIKKGKTFGEALGEYPSVFPKYYQEMVKAGEKSGNLENSLKLVALQLHKDYSLRRKIRSAMMYPLIIFIAMIGIGILMLIYVVPTLVSTFSELGVELPASTRAVIYVSNSLLTSGLIMLGAVIILGGLLFRFLKTIRGKNGMDIIFVKLPIIGGINKKFNAARTCRTLSSLITSGVDILEAISITQGVLQNHLYKTVLNNAKERIQRGEAIARSFLDAESLYPPLVGEMIAVGEETGELSQMLLRLAIFYENEVAAATKDLSTIIEPVLMIFMGAVVGFFAVSMISPMYSLVGGIQ
ncbi:MAG: type II secretion system F family protein [Patescibacteria group bacterium]